MQSASSAVRTSGSGSGFGSEPVPGAVVPPPPAVGALTVAPSLPSTSVTCDTSSLRATVAAGTTAASALAWASWPAG